MRKYLIGAFRSLLKQDEFNDALPGYLPPDSASQARLPILRKKLKEIAGLLDECKRHAKCRKSFLFCAAVDVVV